MKRVLFHDREMEISIQYHVMLIHQLNDNIKWHLLADIYLENFATLNQFLIFFKKGTFPVLVCIQLF